MNDQSVCLSVWNLFYHLFDQALYEDCGRVARLRSTHNGYCVMFSMCVCASVFFVCLCFCVCVRVFVRVGFSSSVDL